MNENDQTPTPEIEYPIIEQHDGFETREYPKRIEYNIPFIGRNEVITIMKPCIRYGELSGSRINWSGCGAQIDEAAECMAAALLHAAATARGLDIAAGL